MRPHQPTLCFTCGQECGEPPRLNLLGDGSRCPACKDRVLDALPALLPAARNLETIPGIGSPVHRIPGPDEARDWTEPPGEARY